MLAWQKKMLCGSEGAHTKPVLSVGILVIYRNYQLSAKVLYDYFNVSFLDPLKFIDIIRSLIVMLYLILEKLTQLQMLLLSTVYDFGDRL